MAFHDDGADAPPPNGESLPSGHGVIQEVTHGPTTDNAYYSSDYNYGPLADPPSEAIGSQASEVAVAPASVQAEAVPPVAASPPRRPPPPSSPPPPDDENDREEEGMLRMSFLGHLEELRRRIFYVLGGFGLAFLVSLLFCNDLWRIVSDPAVDALRQLHVNPPNLSQLTPMEAFNVIWVKVPVLCSIFISSPWILYQVWAFVSPGLYKRERRWAAPFVISTAGLFITGGLFAYFVAFRFGLVFLLGLGRDVHVTPLVSINEYFDLFVNVTLGIGLVFEMPILIFFLTLLRLVTPQFLIRNSRYAILIIVIIAAVVTPTPDIFNLLLFATPMILLFYMGIFASYLLILNREGKRFPWRPVLLWALAIVAILAAAAWFAGMKFHYHPIPRWPFFSR